MERKVGEGKRREVKTNALFGWREIDGRMVFP